ncbi:rod shape-determining protein MreD [Oceaniglobus indicus]|uniref:rod shape-determining protein MreD n=1 Tax=Oceaniglobus indicus TaxID=2047749 RepID=UPI000C1943C6|nr:rod shape-determining protein MreD [Oceaniglobus indicus]
MVDPQSRKRALYRGLYVLMMVAVVFVHLLPFGLGDTHVPGPDILTLLAFAWVLRRPDYIPAFLVALVTLFCDIVFLRPLGLWTALVLIGFEFLRNRAVLAQEQPFLVEWFMVGATLSFMTMANAAILAVFLVPQPPFAMAALQMVISVAFYPVVALVSRYALGVQRPAPGAIEAMRYRA